MTYCRYPSKSCPLFAVPCFHRSSLTHISFPPMIAQDRVPSQPTFSSPFRDAKWIVTCGLDLTMTNSYPLDIHPSGSAKQMTTSRVNSASEKATSGSTTTV